MPQLHLYVAEDLAARIKYMAEARGMTVSRYLAEIVGREVGGAWSDGYFAEVVGGWSGEPLDRETEGGIEERERTT